MGTKTVSECLADLIDAVLPQTQCTRCGYPSCRDYAVAIAGDEALINRCPPGGDETIEILAELLGVSPLAMDQSCGASGPLKVAFIDEQWCIGCTICIQACPVDAIVGAAKLMHTVLASECTGCELCVQPCPTDCIEMLPVTHHPLTEDLSVSWTPARAGIAKRRFYARQTRLARLKEERSTRIKRTSLRHASVAAKKLAIAQAVARVRASRDVNVWEGNDEPNKTD